MRCFDRNVVVARGAVCIAFGLFQEQEPKAPKRERVCIMLRQWTIALAVLVSLVAAGTDQAQGQLVRLDGITATASTSEAPVANLVDYTKTSFDAAIDAVIANSDNWNTQNYVNQADTWVKFDLGSVESIDHMRIFNFASSGDSYPRHIVSADIWYASDSTTTDNPTDADNGGWTKYASGQAFAEASPLDPSASNPYTTPTDLAMGLSARYVCINNMVNGGPTQWWGNGYALHTVEFMQTVPEPSSVTLIGAAAFGLLAYAWRKRK